MFCVNWELEGQKNIRVGIILSIKTLSQCPCDNEITHTLVDMTRTVDSLESIHLFAGLRSKVIIDCDKWQQVLQ